MTTKAIVPGSLTDVAQRQSIALAETFLNVDLLAIVDMSGSMLACDARGGQSRVDVAEEELKHLQGEMPGKVGVIAFSSVTIFCPDGIPTRLMAGTDMASALRYVKPADGTGIRLILISDGQPDDPDETLAVARTFSSQIDVVFVGPETDYYRGRTFLDELARATGGRSIKAQRIAELEAPIKYLLGTM